MPKKKAQSFDLNEWAESCQPPNACHTCQSPEVVEAIRVVLQARADGRSRVSVRQLLEMLTEYFGYEVGVNGLNAHLRGCEKDLMGLAWPKRK
jgi:hypothetical protein